MVIEKRICLKDMGLEKHIRRSPPEQGERHCGISWCGVELFSWNVIPSIDIAYAFREDNLQVCCPECKKAIKEAIGAW